MWNPLPNLTGILARGAKPIGAFGLVPAPLPTLTNRPFWLAHHSLTLLPIITSRGVKYTHDIQHTVLHSNRGPPGLCGISQASDPKKVVVTDPPTARHNVATPHAVATLIHGGVDPTTTSSWAYGVYSHIEANYFGKEFLRMAGIVQMLHARTTPNDKYPYAHPKRVRRSQQARTQARTLPSMASAIPGSCRTRSWQFTHCQDPHSKSSPVWPIPFILLA